MIIAKYVAVALIGYLIGSIPFGLLISRRQHRDRHQAGWQRQDRHDQRAANGRQKSRGSGARS